MQYCTPTNSNKKDTIVKVANIQVAIENKNLPKSIPSTLFLAEVSKSFGPYEQKIS